MSIAWDVLTAAKTILVGLTIPKVTPSDIRIRRRFERIQQEVAPGIFLVGEIEENREEESSGRIILAYPVTLGFVSPRDNTADWAQWDADIRQQVRRTLHRPTLTGVAGVRNVDFDPAPAVNVSSWGDSYEIGAMRFSWWSDEARNG